MFGSRSNEITEMIALCEPQCWGFEHAPFNAALLETVRLAEPIARLVFMGEGTHLSSVRAEMASNGLGRETERIEWQQILIPPRELGGRPRLLAERACCAQVLKSASEAGARHLIFCSLTAEGLLWLKAMLLTRRQPFAVLATLHGILATIDETQPRSLRRWMTSLRQVLRLPHPRQLTYLAMAPPIRANLLEILPRAAPFFRAIDHPYFMAAADTGSVHHQPLRFGFLGVARVDEKRFDTFVRLAQEVARTPSLSESQFDLVGFLGDDARSMDGVAGVIRNASSRPISSDEYAARARQVTYAIGMADPRHYRLVPSASFLDALRYGKPGIYLRNCYLEHYFHKIGDVGYLCDSYEEARDVVFSILRQFPESRYLRQCENIRRGRSLFEPDSVAGRLSDILAEAERTVRAGHPRPAGDLPTGTAGVTKAPSERAENVKL